MSLIKPRTSYKPLACNNGLLVLVSEEDFDNVSKYSWTISCTNKKYYASTTMFGQTIYLHRFLLGLTKDDALIADHINGITTDNRRENLRICDRFQNAQNTVSKPSNKMG